MCYCQNTPLQTVIEQIMYVPFAKCYSKNLEIERDAVLPVTLWSYALFNPQKIYVPAVFPGVKGGLYLGLKNLPHSYDDVLYIQEAERLQFSESI